MAALYRTGIPPGGMVTAPGDYRWSSYRTNAFGKSFRAWFRPMFFTTT